MVRCPVIDLVGESAGGLPVCPPVGAVGGPSLSGRWSGGPVGCPVSGPVGDSVGDPVGGLGSLWFRRNTFCSILHTMAGRLQLLGHRSCKSRIPGFARSGVAVVLQCCGRVAVVLRWCCAGVAVVLRWSGQWSQSIWPGRWSSRWYGRGPVGCPVSGPVGGLVCGLVDGPVCGPVGAVCGPSKHVLLHTLACQRPDPLCGSPSKALPPSLLHRHSHASCIPKIHRLKLVCSRHPSSTYNDIIEFYQHRPQTVWAEIHGLNCCKICLFQIPHCAISC